jgi:hypothetical protein
MFSTVPATHGGALLKTMAPASQVEISFYLYVLVALCVLLAV